MLFVQPKAVRFDEDASGNGVVCDECGWPLDVLKVLGSVWSLRMCVAWIEAFVRMFGFCVFVVGDRR